MIHQTSDKECRQFLSVGSTAAVAVCLMLYPPELVDSCPSAAVLRLRFVGVSLKHVLHFEDYLKMGI